MWNVGDILYNKGTSFRVGKITSEYGSGSGRQFAVNFDAGHSGGFLPFQLDVQWVNTLYSVTPTPVIASMEAAVQQNIEASPTFYVAPSPSPSPTLSFMPIGTPVLFTPADITPERVQAELAAYAAQQGFSAEQTASLLVTESLPRLTAAATFRAENYTILGSAAERVFGSRPDITPTGAPAPSRAASLVKAAIPLLLLAFLVSRK